MATGTYTAYLTHYNAADTPGGNDFMGSEHRIGSSVTFTVNTGTVSNVGLGTDIVNATPQQVYVRNTATANNAALSMDGTAYKPTVSISGTGTGNDAKYKRLNADDIYQDSSWRTDSATVEHGWTVDVSLKASASFDSTTTATLTIGNASDQLAITTGAADVTPDAFNSSLTDVTNNTYTGMAKSTVITSNIMTLSGTNQVTSVGLSGNTCLLYTSPSPRD